MQEEIENRTVNFAVSTTKLTARAVIDAFRAYKNYQSGKKIKNEHAHVRGKQSVKQLLGQDQGATSLPIEETGLRDFKRIAGRYGIDYAITKDKAKGGRYLVFFKGRDMDAMTAAFAEFTSVTQNVEKRPSLRKELKRLRDLVAGIPKKIRRKDRER